MGCGTSVHAHRISQMSVAVIGTANPLKCYKAGDDLPPLLPGVYRLFVMRYCPYSQRVRIVLEYKRIPYELLNVALRTQAPSWLKDRHPLGAVPILERYDEVIYESLVLCQYVDDLHHVTRRLTPADPFKKAHQGMLAATWDKAYAAFHEVCDHMDDLELWEKLLVALDLCEKEVAHSPGPYFRGAHPCMVDLTAWPLFERLPALELINPALKLGPPTRFPRLLAWQELMPQLHAVQLCLVDKESHALVLKSFLTDKPAYGHGLQ